MTDKDKAKAYDKVIERAIKHRNNDGLTLEQYETIDIILPELAESEDEKIRKELIFYFQEEIPQCSIQEHADKMKEFIAWLEKQGDKKEDMIQNACEAFCQVRCKGNPPRSTCTSLGTCMEHDDFCKAIKKRGEHKPAWSIKDEYYLNSCITKIEIDIQYWEHHGGTMVDVDKEIISWLKSIKDRVQPK